MDAPVGNVAPIGTGYKGEWGTFVCTISDPIDRWSTACLNGKHSLCDGWGVDGDPCEDSCHPKPRRETPGCDICSERISLDDLMPSGSQRPHGVTLCREHIVAWLALAVDDTSGRTV